MTYAPGPVEEQLAIGLDAPRNGDLLRAPVTPDINGVTGARTGGGGCSAKAGQATGVVKGTCVKPVAIQPAQADAASIDLAADDAVKAVPKISVAPVDR